MAEHIVPTMRFIVGFVALLCAGCFMCIGSSFDKPKHKAEPESEGFIELDPKPQVKWRFQVWRNDDLIFDEWSDDCPEKRLLANGRGWECHMGWKDTNGMLHHVHSGHGMYTYRRQVIVQPKANEAPYVALP